MAMSKEEYRKKVICCQFGDGKPYCPACGEPNHTNDKVKHKERYHLDFENKETQGNQHLIVYMMNPSTASDLESDKTVTRLLDSLEDSYRFIHIINNSPIIASSANNLDAASYNFDSLIQKFKTNHREISKLLEKVSNADVLIATGEIKGILEKTSYKKIMRKLWDASSKLTLYSLGLLESNYFAYINPLRDGERNQNLLKKLKAFGKSNKSDKFKKFKKYLRIDMESDINPNTLKVRRGVKKEKGWSSDEVDGKMERLGIASKK